MPRSPGRALHWMALVVCTCAWLLVPAVGHAQDAKAKREARNYLKAGDAALQRGDRLAKRRGHEDDARAQYQKALDSYNSAYEAYPQPQIYFAIGNAEEKLGHYLDAYGHYRRLQEEAEHASDALKDAVQQHIDAVLEHLTLVTLTAKPDGAAVFVDEREIGTSPLAEPIVLEAGPHRISVRKDGYKPGHDEFQTEGGNDIDKSIELEPLPKVEEALAETKTPAKPKRRVSPPGRGILLSSLVGTGVLALGTGGFGIAALTQHGISSDTSEPFIERDNAREKGKRYAVTSDVLLGATVAAGAWTAYYYYFVYRPRAERLRAQSGDAEDTDSGDEERGAWLAPYASQGGVGVALGGRF